MEWSDEGFVLAARRHGEHAAIVTLLTRAHGRHLGLAPGGAGQRARGLYEAGNRVQATWRARLTEHLGHYACELAASHAAALLDDPLRLAALTAATAVAEAALPEREPHPRAYDGLGGLIEALRDATDDLVWQAAHVRWEADLLAELGFGLDLARCAATGDTDDLVFVSPRTGRAVSAAAGAAYRDRLLPLPAYLAGSGPAAPPADLAAILAGLRLTGFFLDRHVFGHRPAAARDGAGLPGRAPAARERFVTRLKGSQ